MGKVQENKHIAKLIVGAMSIDGELSKDDQLKVVAALQSLGMNDLVADFGEALETDYGDFDLYQESKELLAVLGDHTESSTPIIFRLICNVVVSDRFVSVQEASYLSALGKRFKLTIEASREIFKSVMVQNRARLEVAPKNIDAMLHPHLKELLSFEGADQIVGPHSEDSLEEMLESARENVENKIEYTTEDVHQALTSLGVSHTASLEEAKEAWLNGLKNTDLMAMARFGESFVGASLIRLSEMTKAYQILVQVRESLELKDRSKVEVERLEKKLDREKVPNSRDQLAGRLETELK